ncbi:MAG: bifunctional riboflavin kinase/FAD synthetase [Clostridia bacterium]|nr:bifunctional riboflavin kinase/FAD synthetase [Clostridia bacterium]
MKVFHSLQYRSDTKTVVALGCFDGVHLGHAAVLKTAADTAKALGVPSLALAFNEPPKNFFVPDSVPLLTETPEKEARIASLGIDLLLSVPFDQSVAELSAEDFLKTVLRDQLRAAHIVCGFNFSFGAGGKGNLALLSDFCRREGIGLSACPPTVIDGQTVSSSLIRNAIANGELDLVRRLLGRNYSIQGEVVNGQHLARNLGFPTFNQLLSYRIAIPRYGVYATRVSGASLKESRFGITNVGIRPTVSENLLCAETHIFDFAGDLYGQHLTVEFLAFLRPETPFPTLDALKEQVEKDIERAKDIISIV